MTPPVLALVAALTATPCQMLEDCRELVRRQGAQLHAAKEAIITWRTAARIYERERDGLRLQLTATSSAAVGLRPASIEAQPPPPADPPAILGAGLPLWAEILVGVGLVGLGYAVGSASSGPGVTVVR